MAIFFDLASTLLDHDVAERAAAAYLEAEKHFRHVMEHKSLWVLEAEGANLS